MALPIFPGSRPPSIVGANELNFCVRDGNRWTLIAINTNSYGWGVPHRLYPSPVGLCCRLWNHFMIHHPSSCRLAGFRSLQTDAAKCKQLHLQSLFSFRRLAPADDYLGSPVSFPSTLSASFPQLSSLPSILLGFPLRFPVASSFFPLLPLPFRSASTQFRILSFLFFLSALHRFRLPVAFPTPRSFLSSAPDLPRS